MPDTGPAPRAGCIGIATNVVGSEVAFSRPALAMTTAMYGSRTPSTSATIATCRSTFHSTAASTTDTVRTDIEMT